MSVWQNLSAACGSGGWGREGGKPHGQRGLRGRSSACGPAPGRLTLRSTLRPCRGTERGPLGLFSQAPPCAHGMRALQISLRGPPVLSFPLFLNSFLILLTTLPSRSLPIPFAAPFFPMFPPILPLLAAFSFFSLQLPLSLLSSSLAPLLLPILHPRFSFPFFPPLPFLALSPLPLLLPSLQTGIPSCASSRAPAPRRSHADGGAQLPEGTARARRPQPLGPSRLPPPRSYWTPGTKCAHISLQTGPLI